MAHFYGSIQGARGEATRLGHKSSGLTTVAASWAGAVRVTLSHDERTGRDMAHVELAPWQGRGASRELYSGPVAGDERQKGPGTALAASQSDDPGSDGDPWRRGYAAGYRAAQDALGVRFVGDSLIPVAPGVSVADRIENGAAYGASRARRDA